MKKIFRPIDYDIIYLSYDEPNAEKNYADLLVKVPWAKRVHGIKGSDTAHKACAKLSETPRFTTVDGDNIIRSDFLNIEIDMEKYPTLEDSVISWSGYNIINGLMYGNGGLKCWTVDFVMNMRTHEACDPKDKVGQVDFCWDNKYIQMNDCYSDVHNNATPFQAWRAGFREGVKMCLDRGKRPSLAEFEQRVYQRNYDHLCIWQSLGRDVENGEWAIYGARLGTYLTMFTDWDYTEVQDFDKLKKLWEKFEHSPPKELTEQLKLRLSLPIVELNAEQSRFFKHHYKSWFKNRGVTEVER